MTDRWRGPAMILLGVALFILGTLIGGPLLAH